jgi:hypothetical protein
VLSLSLLTLSCWEGIPQQSSEIGVQDTQDSEANLREEFWNIVEFSKGTRWWEKKHFITSTVSVANSLSQDETDLGATKIIVELNDKEANMGNSTAVTKEGTYGINPQNRGFLN